MVDSRLVRRVALLSLHSSPVARLGKADAGGMNLYVRQLADGLSASGVQADIFTRRTHPEAPESTILPSGARLINLNAGPARRLPKSVLPLHLPAMVSAMRAFADGQGTDYDVVHSHYWLSGLAAMRYRSTQPRPSPFVHMFHTLSQVKELYVGQPDPGDSALRADGERCVLSRADVVVGAIEAERNEMRRVYGRAPARYAVIPPGVDLHRFRPRGKDAARRQLGIQAERVILFVGRSDPLKGLDTLLHAVAEIPGELRRGLKLVLVGGTDPREPTYGRRFRRTIQRLGLEGTVETHGLIDQEQLPLYYSAADLCAIPSAYESFGMVALEAMACQTPVLAFRVGGLATTIRDGRTGFLAQSRSPHAFAQRLAGALTFPDLEAMGRRARMSVQSYSWEATVTRTLDLYEEIAAEYMRPGLPVSAGGG